MAHRCACLRRTSDHAGTSSNLLTKFLTILQVLAQSGGDRHVLVGDMNALRPGEPVGTPPAGEVRRGDAVDGALRVAIGRILEAGYVDCFRQTHPRRRGFTYPSHSPWLRLDYIFAWPRVAPYIDCCDVIDTRLARRASDHLPVLASFHRPPPVDDR